MNILINLLVEYDAKGKIARSHALRGGTTSKVCRCALSKTMERHVHEGVDISKSDRYNLCEASRKALKKDLDKLGDWNSGRPTAY